MKKKIIIGILSLTVIAAALCYVFFYQGEERQAVILSKQELQNTDALQKELQLSRQEAASLREELAKQRRPEIQYVIKENTIAGAAVEVKKDIDAGKAPANQIPADRTALVANEQEQKVEVYRIILDKKWELGGGAVWSGSRLQLVAAVQYNMTKNSGIEIIVGKNIAGGIIKRRF